MLYFDVKNLKNFWEGAHLSVPPYHTYLRRPRARYLGAQIYVIVCPRKSFAVYTLLNSLRPDFFKLTTRLV